MAVEIEGEEALNKALSRLAAASPEAASKASMTVAFKIQRSSMKNTPVEYGVLRASAYTHRVPGGAEVGYTSSYALFVHENMEQVLKGQPRPSGLGTYWNPGGPKFLERAVQEHEKDFVAEVESEIAAIVKGL